MDSDENKYVIDTYKLEVDGSNANFQTKKISRYSNNKLHTEKSFLDTLIQYLIQPQPTM